MNNISVMALFCEDIREEKNDMFTLVGLLPDTVSVMARKSGNSPPDGAGARHLPKLSLFVRINFDPDYDLPVPKTRIVLPDGNVVPLGDVNPAVIAKAKSESKAKGNILAGVIIRAAMGNFGIPKLGPLKAEVVIGDTVYLAAALNFREEVTSSSEQPPPS